jgi:hypothetical protein
MKISALCLAMLPIVAVAAEQQIPLNRSYIAFTIPEKDLLPENVAYDSGTGAFFVGSTRKGKILRVLDGAIAEFVAPRAHGLWMVVGMKADAERRALWVASSYGSNLVDAEPRNGSPAGLFRFNLDTGELDGRWLLDDAGSTHFLNDLVVARNGDVFVTHMMEKAAIYRLDAETGTFTPFLHGDAAFTEPNGITINDRGDTLYVAHDEGISRIDIEERSRRQLTMPEGVTGRGIDGLYYYKFSLVAVHPWPGAVRRYSMGGDGVTGVEILESDHPMFSIPTTGAMVGDTLYYVANAQFNSFDRDGTLFPMERLYEPVILKLNLLGK